MQTYFRPEPDVLEYLDNIPKGARNREINLALRDYFRLKEKHDKKRKGEIDYINERLDRLEEKVQYLAEHPIGHDCDECLIRDYGVTDDE